MISPQLPAPRRRWWIWGAAGVVLVLGAVLLLGRGVPGREPLSTPAVAQPAAPPGTGGGAALAPADGAGAASAAVPAPGGAGGPVPPAGDAAPPGPGAGAPPPSVDRSLPVELRIPAIEVSTRLSTLGLNPDDTVEVPTDYQQAGWFDLGPSPGQLGSSVVLGHVDSRAGPAVFFRLRSLRPGDAVEVTRADGAVVHFAVTTVETHPKEQFPAERVYAPHGISALHLVTCGGEFDPRTRSYESNVVAYTSLVAVTPAP